MSWLKDFVRPKIRALIRRKELPDNLWTTCGQCGQMLFQRDFVANHYVCHHCQHHMRIPARARIQGLLDDGFAYLPLPKVLADPLKFRDTKKYPDRLKESRQRSGLDDAILVAEGHINGQPVVVAAFSFDFMGGSMGLSVGQGVVIAAERAIKSKSALITVPSSGGARMQEGILSLMQMPRSVIAVERVKEAGLPYITLLTDPTTGGVSASFAMLGDIAIAEPAAIIGFAGARIIEESLRQKLPERFQQAEYLLEHGMVDMVVHRHNVRETLATLLKLIQKPVIAA